MTLASIRNTCLQGSWLLWPTVHFLCVTIDESECAEFGWWENQTLVKRWTRPSQNVKISGEKRKKNYTTLNKTPMFESPGIIQNTTLTEIQLTLFLWTKNRKLLVGHFETAFNYGSKHLGTPVKYYWNSLMTLPRCRIVSSSLWQAAGREGQPWVSRILSSSTTANVKPFQSSLDGTRKIGDDGC